MAPLVIRVGHRDADTRKEKGCGPSRWGEPHLSADPMEGASALGGAEGDRTFLWALGWKEGLTDIPQSGQGGKRGPFDPALLPTLRISRLIAPASSFPRFLPVTEEHPVDPLDPYGASKHHVEHYLRIYKPSFGVDFTVLRYPHVYGPRQNPYGEAGVVAIFTAKMLQMGR